MRAPYRHHPDDSDDEWDDGPHPASAPYLEVDVTDNPVVAVLLDLHGDPLIEVWGVSRSGSASAEST